MFTDAAVSPPIVQSTHYRHRPIVTFMDDAGQWPSLSRGFASKLPLTNLLWQSSSGRRQRIPELNIQLVPFNPAQVSKTDKMGTVAMEHQQPFLHLFFVNCDDADIYKSKTKQAISDWLDAFKANQKQEWLIVYLSFPPDPSKAKKSQISKLQLRNVFDRIKSDFDGKTSRCFQLRGQEGEAKLSESWDELMGKIRDCIMKSFDRRTVHLEDAVRKMLSNQHLPGWNYCNFFILKEELAFTFDTLTLTEEALFQYIELETIFFRCASMERARSGGKIPWMEQFGPSDMRDDSTSVFDPSLKPYREMIQKNTITVFDFRVYLFAKKSQFYRTLERPLELVTQGYSFVTELAFFMGREPGISVAWLCSWIFSVCSEILEVSWNIAQFMRTPMSRTDIQAFAVVRADLCAYAREQLDQLGVKCKLLPSRRPFSQHSALDDGPLASPSVLMAASVAATGELIKSHASGQGESDKPSHAQLDQDVPGVKRRQSSLALGSLPSSSSSGSLSTTFSFSDNPTQGPPQGPPVAFLTPKELAEQISNTRLQTALESPGDFDALYTALCEMAIRECLVSQRARHTLPVMHMLAELNFHRGNYYKAEELYGRMCRRYLTEGWSLLDFDVRKKFSICQRLTKSHESFIKSCILLCSDASPFPLDDRLYYFKELLTVARTSQQTPQAGQRRLVCELESCMTASLDRVWRGDEFGEWLREKSRGTNEAELAWTLLHRKASADTSATDASTSLAPTSPQPSPWASFETHSSQADHFGHMVKSKSFGGISTTSETTLSSIDARGWLDSSEDLSVPPPLPPVEVRGVHLSGDPFSLHSGCSDAPKGFVRGQLRQSVGDELDVLIRIQSRLPSSLPCDALRVKLVSPKTPLSDGLELHSTDIKSSPFIDVSGMTEIPLSGTDLAVPSIVTESASVPSTSSDDPSLPPVLTAPAPLPSAPAALMTSPVSPSVSASTSSGDSTRSTSPSAVSPSASQTSSTLSPSATSLPSSLGKFIKRSTSSASSSHSSSASTPISASSPSEPDTADPSSRASPVKQAAPSASTPLSSSGGSGGSGNTPTTLTGLVTAATGLFNRASLQSFASSSSLLDKISFTSTKDASSAAAVAAPSSLSTSDLAPPASNDTFAPALSSTSNDGEVPAQADADAAPANPQESDDGQFRKRSASGYQSTAEKPRAHRSRTLSGSSITLGPGALGQPHQQQLSAATSRATSPAASPARPLSPYNASSSSPTGSTAEGASKTALNFFTFTFEAKTVTIHPGENTFVFRVPLPMEGQFRFGFVDVDCGALSICSGNYWSQDAPITVVVASSPPSVKLCSARPVTGVYISQIVQQFALEICTDDDDVDCGMLDISPVETDQAGLKFFGGQVQLVHRDAKTGQTAEVGTTIGFDGKCLPIPSIPRHTVLKLALPFQSSERSSAVQEVLATLKYRRTNGETCEVRETLFAALSEPFAAKFCFESFDSCICLQCKLVSNCSTSIRLLASDLKVQPLPETAHVVSGNGHLESLLIEPMQEVSLAWMVRFNDAITLESITSQLQVHYTIVGTDGRDLFSDQVFSSSFSFDPIPPCVRVDFLPQSAGQESFVSNARRSRPSLTLDSPHASTLVIGEPSPFELRIVSAAPGVTRLKYEISSSPDLWMIFGRDRGIVELKPERDGSEYVAVVPISLIPVVGGELTLPSVALWHLLDDPAASKPVGKRVSSLPEQTPAPSAAALVKVPFRSLFHSRQLSVR